LTPRIQSILPEIRNLLLRAARRPSRLAIWLTAAIAAVVMAVSACAALPAVSVSGMAGSNHAKNVGESGQGGAPAAAAPGSARSSSAASGHPARHASARHTSAGHRSHHAARVHAAAADKDQKLHPLKAAASHARRGSHRTAVKARTAVSHRVRHSGEHSRGHQHGHHAAMRPAVHRGVSHRRHVSHEAAAAAKPYLIYDSVTPGAIPAGRAAAVYSTGPYAAQPSEVAGHNPVVWIDTRGSNPGASALDVEPGDATPAIAADWARRRLTANPHGLARIYTMRSEWASVQAAVSSLSSWMRSRIRYWIADPTGSPHIVPGSDATQWYWGKHYDITTANPRF
jgi:hypothetical protein